MNKGNLSFVIQKHKAKSLHYDLRLQIGDAMRSWSIPRGPTLDPGMKRLAMPTTDHNTGYSHFEGVIPEGSYGAGPVMIWDEGTYNPEIEIGRAAREEIKEKKEANRIASESMGKGNLKFTLYGKKLHGSFALVRTSFGGREAWLLIKHKDKFCKTGYDAGDYPRSAVSGMTIEQVKAKG